MSKTALFIKHRALAEQRDEVRRIWEKHLKARIVANPAHELYFYCYDDNDPDTICVFQQYADRESSQKFMETPWYAAYINEVALLLAGQPEISVATPVWAKSSVG